MEGIDSSPSPTINISIVGKELVVHIGKRQIPLDELRVPQVVYILADPTIKALENDLRIEKAKLNRQMDRKHARLYRREQSLKEKQNLQRQQDKELQKESQALEKEMRSARNSWMKMKDRALS